MRKLFLMLFLCIGVAAYAQEEPFKKSISVELGGGIGPLHMSFPGVCPTSLEKNTYAKQGQSVYCNNIIFPEVALGVAWRFARKWELSAIGGVSWGEYTINTHEQFGIDQYGEPRYDASTVKESTKKLSPLYFNTTVQARVLWNPDSQVQAYSAFGVGLAVVGHEWAPFPAITPIAVRYGGKHLYGFLENAFTTNSLLLHGGVGWKF
jgi:hypothetical protein